MEAKPDAFDVLRNAGPNPKLCVGFYSPGLPDSGVPNGIVTYTRLMRDALRSIDHSVIVVTDHAIEGVDGVIRELPKLQGPIARLRAILEARHGSDGCYPMARVQILQAFRAARRAGAQIFEMEESFGWSRRLVGRGIPIVQRLHGPHALLRNATETPQQTAGNNFREKAELAGFTAVDAITSPTQRLLDELLKLYTLQLPIARAIPNPILAAPESAQWRLPAANTDQILFVGRFDPLKGADIAIRAFAKALERRPSLTMVMVGPDGGLPQQDGSRVHFDEFAATELAPEVRSRIRFLGPQSPAQIAELRLRSGFAIVASRFENFPYSIAEAMAVGMPVLSTNTFGGAEMIRDGIDGRIVPVADVGSTAAAMVSMLSDTDRLAAMGRSGYSRAAEWLAPERVARESVALYRQTIDLTVR